MKVQKKYQINIDNLNIELSALKKKSTLWSYIRILVVLGGFAVVTILSDILPSGYLISITVFLIAFLGFAVSRHLKVSDLTDQKQKLKKINQNEISVIDQGDNIYGSGNEFVTEYSEISNDLDLLGDGSVFHFINRCSTYFGNKILKDYLMIFNNADVIIERQAAVEELSDELEWKQNYQKELFDLDKNNNYNRLIGFVASDTFISDKKSVLNFFFALNVVMLAIFIASFLLFSEFSFSVFMVLFVVNSFISYRYFKEVNLFHQMVSENGKSLSAFFNALVLLENKKWSSRYLANLSERNNNYSVEIKRLKKLIELFDFRLNIVVGTVLNVFLLWDLRILSKLELWKNKNPDVKSHLEIIGEFEALSSLSIIKYNNPDICFPKISEKEFEIAAKGMYHPLINKNEVVVNDYELEGNSRLDIITGPNMSGKSTFLRSVAINMILARTGSVVFANKFVFTPSEVLTYLHITDSIKDKISTFKAEIIKLKSILNSIETSEVPTFFILDEILRGTNSHSKFKGSVAVVKRLLELESSGIIATHDVHLGEMKNDYQKEIRNFSFDFIVDNKQELVYDYKLKQGINTKVNAEIVLKELGLVL